MSRSQFAVVILAGAMLRAAALPFPGTGDVTVWKIWSYNARHRVADMYGVGGSPPERRVLEYEGRETTVDYPPLALYELGAAGEMYWRWSHRHFPNTRALNATVKLPGLVAEVGLLLLLFCVVRRHASVPAARWAATAYWLNPAALLDASVLGYLDPQFIFPAAAALVAAASGWAALAGALAAAAVLTKAQGIFIAPAIALGIWNGGAVRRRAMRLAIAATAATLTCALAIAPIAAAGALPNMFQALGRLAHHDMLSANACNLWWIVGYVLRASYAVSDTGVWAAFTMPTRILGISRVMELGYPNPRAIGAVLTLAAAAWAMWTARRARDVWLLAALAAFLVHAYATLSAQVHENHLFAAVPLLVLAAAGRPRLWPIAIAVSLIVALNLNLFYGFGNGVGYAMPRALTVVDASVLLAVLNCLVLWRHATVLRRECSTEAKYQMPAPGSNRGPVIHSRSSESCT